MELTTTGFVICLLFPILSSMIILLFHVGCRDHDTCAELAANHSFNRSLAAPLPPPSNMPTFRWMLTVERFPWKPLRRILAVEHCRASGISGSFLRVSWGNIELKVHGFSSHFFGTKHSNTIEPKWTPSGLLCEATCTFEGPACERTKGRLDGSQVFKCSGLCAV